MSTRISPLNQVRSLRVAAACAVALGLTAGTAVAQGPTANGPFPNWTEGFEAYTVGQRPSQSAGWGSSRVITGSNNVPLANMSVVNTGPPTPTFQPLNFTITDPTLQGTLVGRNRALMLFGSDADVNDPNIAFRVWSATPVWPGASVNTFFVSTMIRWEAGTIDTDDQITIWVDDQDTGNHTQQPQFGIVGNNNGVGDFYVNVVNNAAGAINAVPSTATSGTYFLVMRVTRDVSGFFRTVDLWVNPSRPLDNLPPTVSATAGSGSGGKQSFRYLGIKTANLDANDRILIDGTRIGLTWDQVYPNNTTLLAKVDSVAANWNNDERSVDVEWNVSEEIGTAGYHVYRAFPNEVIGDRVTQDLVTTPMNPGEGNKVYQFRDNLWWLNLGAGSNGYYLAEVENDGDLNVSGPFPIIGLPQWLPNPGTTTDPKPSIKPIKETTVEADPIEAVEAQAETN